LQLFNKTTSLVVECWFDRHAWRCLSAR
jgi:hypothetical protein